MNFLTNLAINAKIRLSNNQSDREKLIQPNKNKPDHSKFSTKDTRSNYPASKVPYKKFANQSKYEGSSIFQSEIKFYVCVLQMNRTA